MNYKVILFLLLISTSTFALTSNTTYTCQSPTTLFENTTYSDGSVMQGQIPCENGCLNGYCVSISETNNYLNLTTILLLLVSIILIIIGLDFKNDSYMVGMSITGLGILIVLLNIFLVGVYAQGFTNPIMEYVGNVGFTIATLFLIGFSLLAIAVVGLAIIRRRSGGLVGWDE